MGNEECLVNLESVAVRTNSTIVTIIDTKSKLSIKTYSLQTKRNVFLREIVRRVQLNAGLGRVHAHCAATGRMLEQRRERQLARRAAIDAQHKVVIVADVHRRQRRVVDARSNRHRLREVQRGVFDFQYFTLKPH